jgi:hypothetical protein
MKARRKAEDEGMAYGGENPKNNAAAAQYNMKYSAGEDNWHGDGGIWRLQSLTLKQTACARQRIIMARHVRKSKKRRQQRKSGGVI